MTERPARPVPDDELAIGPYVMAVLQNTLSGGLHEDRRLGRALAFQALYEADQAHHAPLDVLERLASGADASFPRDLLESATTYARTLVEAVHQHQVEIDDVIRLRTPAWPIEQMSAVDRNVLRIGLYEALFSSDTVPVKAAINEAVDLAKSFGSETSSRFVNGVLGRAVESRGAPSTHARNQPPADPAALESSENQTESTATDQSPGGGAEEDPLHP